MFTKISPQHAQDSSGFSVFVVDREHIGYKDALIEVQIEADLLCMIVPLYLGTLKVKGLAIDFSPDIVIKRVQEGLSFLGINHELVK